MSSGAQDMIIGCGDIGRRLALRLQAEQQPVQAFVRSPESLQRCREIAVTARQLDLDAPLSIDAAQFDDCRLFYFVAPPRQGMVDDRLRRFLQHVGKRPQRIVLISTTGVYGDCAGAWVDETQALNPQADRAKRRVDAEQALRDWADSSQREFVILRVPGIYAQDRLPLARLLRGEPLLVPQQSPYTNRIHADDLAAICAAAMRSEITEQVFNASDGHPLTMTEYFNHVADFAGIARPPLVGLEQARQSVSSGMLSYLLESRRVSNRKLLASLAVTLQYPTLADALPIHFPRAD